MHSRHRSPGNGYRSVSMGMGLSASRISPEVSVRGHGMYNSENRNFNRGFGRGHGQPKSFPPSHLTPRKNSGDLFMEAGRLAAEYLVSKGFLPPSVLPPKWQAGNLKKQAGDFQNLRSQEGGITASDMGVGMSRKRYADDYASTGSKNQFKGRRKGGSFGYDLDFGKDYGINGSWSDGNRASDDMEPDDVTSSGHHEAPVAKDVDGLQKSSLINYTVKSEEAGNSGTALDRHSLQDEEHSRAESSVTGDEQPDDSEFSKLSSLSTRLYPASGELKDGVSDNGTEIQVAAGDSSFDHCTQEDDPSCKNSTDLLTTCNFAKVPTKTRSSLNSKGSKVVMSPNNEGSISDIGPLKGTEIPGEGNQLDAYLPCRTNAPVSDSETSKMVSVHPAEYVGDLHPAHDVEKIKCHRSQSFTDVVLIHENGQELSQVLPDLKRSRSMFEGRGEKQVVQETSADERSKRPRGWSPSLPLEADKWFDLSSKNNVSKGSSQGGKVTVKVDNRNLVNKSLSSMVDGEQPHRYAEERQLFPSSFKICDLNLMGASETNENYNNDLILVLPPISGIKKESHPVDVDLSMSSSSMSCEYSTLMSNGKEIEVIDLEDDSPEEAKASDYPERKPDNGFMSFTRHQTTADISNDPDYNEGLMMAEFLGPFGNIPPISTGANSMPESINPVSQEVDPLQNETRHHSREGALGDDQVIQADDDSIFMSLGEIPLTFLRPWDQPPPQEYEKPF